MNRSVKVLLLFGTHISAIGIGFALGIYLLPILTAPDGPDVRMVRSTANAAQFTGNFRRDLADSDALHWGEGTLYIGTDNIAFEGRLAPGPDYRLYLSPEFTETEAGFEALRSQIRLTRRRSIPQSSGVKVSASSSPPPPTSRS